MSTQSRLEQLLALTQDEIEVLYWTCQGKSRGEITDLISKDIKTYHYHMGKVYLKLKISPELHWRKKRPILFKDYCPLVNELVKSPEDIKRWEIIREEYLKKLPPQSPLQKWTEEKELLPIPPREVHTPTVEDAIPPKMIESLREPLPPVVEPEIPEDEEIEFIPPGEETTEDKEIEENEIEFYSHPKINSGPQTSLSRSEWITIALAYFIVFLFIWLIITYIVSP